MNTDLNKNSIYQFLYREENNHNLNFFKVTVKVVGVAADVDVPVQGEAVGVASI